MLKLPGTGALGVAPAWCSRGESALPPAVPAGPLLAVGAELCGSATGAVMLGRPLPADVARVSPCPRPEREAPARACHYFTSE